MQRETRDKKFVLATNVIRLCVAYEAYCNLHVRSQDKKWASRVIIDPNSKKKFFFGRLTQNRWLYVSIDGRKTSHLVINCQNVLQGRIYFTYSSVNTLYTHLSRQMIRNENNRRSKLSRE